MKRSLKKIAVFLGGRARYRRSSPPHLKQLFSSVLGKTRATIEGQPLFF